MDVNTNGKDHKKELQKPIKIGLPNQQKKPSSMNATGQGSQPNNHFTTTHKQQREFDKRMSQKGGLQQQGLSKEGPIAAKQIGSLMNMNYNIQGVSYINA